MSNNELTKSRSQRDKNHPSTNHDASSKVRETLQNLASIGRLLWNSFQNSTTGEPVFAGSAGRLP